MPELPRVTPPAKELRIPFDHAGEGYDKEAGEEFHRSIPELRKGDPKEVIVRGGTTVEWPGHPKNKEVKSNCLSFDPKSEGKKIILNQTSEQTARILMVHLD